MNEEIADFLIEKNFHVLVSLDGKEPKHNQNRVFPDGSGTFRCVMRNLKYIKSVDHHFFHQRVQASVVISPPVRYLDLNDFFCEIGIRTRPSFVELYGCRRDLPGDWDAQGLQILQDLFARDCIKNRYNEDRGYSSTGFANDLFGVGLRFIQRRASFRSHSDSRVSLGQCILGVRKLFVTTDGSFYPCEKVEGATDVLIGNVRQGVLSERVVHVLERFYSIVKKRCFSCWLMRICPVCLSGVVMGGKFDENKLDFVCRSTRQQYERLFILYCTILQSNKKALDYLEREFPTI